MAGDLQYWRCQLRYCTITFATAAKGGVFDTRRNIALAGTLELNNTNAGASITINGPTVGVTIGGGGPGSNFSVFTVAANTTATLEGLAVTDGYATAGGGITNEAGATLTLTNDSIFGNSAAYGAGVDNHGVLTLNNDTIVGNSASSDGGGIDNEFAATLTVNNGSMSGNKAGEDGAGIENRGTLTVTGAVLSQNNAQRDGGGINNLGTLSVNGSQVSDNSALNGGGIATYDTLTVSTSTLVGNSATSGGGIANFAALTVSASTLFNNSSKQNGGGIFNNGRLTVINSTLTGNSAVASGGGVANELAATGTLSNATVSANSASNGGGIANISGALGLSNTIVAGNNATTAPDIAGVYGGNNDDVVGGPSYLTALENFGGPTNTMALEKGSSAFNGFNGGTVTALTAAVNSTATTVAVTDAGAIASTPGAYLIQVEAEQMLVTSVNLASNTLTVVRGYNGTTAAQHSAQTGVFLPSDQRGITRPRHYAAIGAFQPTSNLTLLVTTTSGSTSGGDGQISLPEAVALASELFGNITITFAGAPGQVFATAQTIKLTAGLSLADPYQSITINGPSAGVTIAGGGYGSNFSVFTVSANTTASLTGLTISDGYTSGNGGGVDNNGQLTLSDVTVSQNYADNGGGIYNAGTLTLSNVTISYNRGSYYIDYDVYGNGGGIYDAGTLGISGNLTVSGNNAGLQGGGIYFASGSRITNSPGTFSISQNEIAGGRPGVSAGGGGVYIAQGVTLTLSNITVSDNKIFSEGDGGGIENEGTLTLSNAIISDNGGSSSYSSGGGIKNGGILTVSNVTISGNSIEEGTGGGILNFGTLTVSNTSLTISNNSDTFGGGGGGISNFGTLTMSNASLTISNNSATGFGGGIYNDGALTVSNLTISGNTARDGGGMYFDQGGTLNVGAGSTFSISGNTASHDGAGVYVVSGGNLALSNATISNNSAGGNGGGIYNAGILSVTGATFSGNSAGNNGGGIDNYGTLTLANVEFTKNSASASGGGFHNEFTSAAMVTANDITLSDNKAIYGGGIDNDNNLNLASGFVALTMSNVTLLDNFATYVGGGIDNNGTQTITGATIAGNAASGLGGGIYNNSNSLTLSDATISGNNSPQGGGIWSQAPLTLRNVTVSGNSAVLVNGAGGQGGGIYNNNATLTVQDSIVAGNSATTGPDIYGGITTDYGHNLLGTALRPTNPGIITTDVFSDQPLLSPLGNYGGPTQTLAVLPGSPAIGTGGPLTTVATTVTIRRGLFFLGFHPTATIAVTNAAGIVSGDSIQIDGVQMVVQTVSGNNLTVAATFNATFSKGNGVYLLGETDQRGFSRPTTTADIGAFQTQAALVVNTTADPVANTPTGLFTGESSGQFSLRDAVNLANVRGGSNTITFAGSSGQPFNTPQTITLSAGLDLANPAAGASITIQGPPAGLTIAGGGAGSNFSVFTVAANTTATLKGLTITAGHTSTNGGGIDNNGTLTVSNATLSANTAGNDGGGIDNTGALTVSNITLTGNEAPNGSGIDNEPGAKLTVNNASVSGTPGGSTEIVNSGTVIVALGSTFSAASADYTQVAGTTTVDGTLSAAGIEVDDGGQTNASIDIDGGILNGTGTIQGNVINNGGTIFPGDDPGTLTVLGDYTQGAAGTLQIEIGGPTNYSQLAISGSATLGGTLDTSFINGFTPGADNSFQTLTSNQLSGSFATMTGLNGDQVTTVTNAGVPALYVNAGQTSPSTVALQTTAASGSVYGQTVTFTAAVTAANSSSAAPTGTVQFRIDGSNFGAPVTLTSGSASISASDLSVGTYTVAAFYSGDSTFLGGSVALSSGQAVMPAPLTITANDQSMVQNTSLPQLTVGYAGFVNGDTATSLTTAPTQSTAVTALSKPGKYPITAGGAVDPNYVITYVPGTLTVTPAPSSIVGRVGATGQWWLGASTGSSFNNTLWTTWNPNVTWVDVLTGDFTGDGRTDIVGRDLKTGFWWVGVSNGVNGFTNSLWGAWNPGVTWVDVQVGDFNHDGKADIIGRVLETGQWWVALSNGSGFTNSLWATWSPAVTWVDVRVGDFNGDGSADIAGRVLQTGQWWVSLSGGATDSTTSLWTTWSPAVTWVDVQVGDFSGPASEDIAGRVLQTGQWWVAVSNGSNTFHNALWGDWSPAVTWVDVHAGDFNGDGFTDIIGRVLQTGQWWVAFSNGSSAFQNSLWATWNPNVTWLDVQVGDFNGDGSDDITGRVASTGQWWTSLSLGTTSTTSLWTTWNSAVTWNDVHSDDVV